MTAAEIARGLTLAMRDFLVSHDGWFATIDRLCVLGLIEEGPDLTPRLTDLGREIRQHLIGETR